jgi:hypothetical protein|tara:strand:- start:566 stop:1201 length:636 start_codon:yes stop_codon:yes gene_type:complete
VNIFALSKDPIESAKQMLDKHIVKMPTESCQMLHTNALFMEYTEQYGQEPSLRQLKEYHKLIDSNLMKPAMLNHPSTIWARETEDNTKWLYEHAIALCGEYTDRYDKQHGTYERILQTPIEFDADSSLATPPLIAMADEYRIENPYDNHCWEYVIDSYRHYYLEGKWKFAEWRQNRMPEWWPKNHYVNKYNEEITAFNKQFDANLKLLKVK